MGSLLLSKNVTPDHDIEKLENPAQNAKLTTPQQGLTLAQFRALVGIPQRKVNPKDGKTYTKDGKTYVTTDDGLRSASELNLASHFPPIQPATINVNRMSSSGPRALILLRLFSRPSFVRRLRSSKSRRRENEDEVEEYATSLYFTLLREESDQHRLYHLYNIVTYSCLVLQLIIASALIIIGAIPSLSSTTSDGHRIAVAVLGATTGLLTGLLSLLKGQGFPNRILQYANRLQEVKYTIELYERTLRANVAGVSVTYQKVVDLWEEFETIRNEQLLNRPDVWATTTAIGAGGAGFMKRAIEGMQAAQGGMPGPNQAKKEPQNGTSDAQEGTVHQPSSNESALPGTAGIQTRDKIHS